MKKGEMVQALADQHEMSRRQMTEIVDGFLDMVTDALKSGDKVALIPFGTFKVRDRKARVGRNPQTGEEVKIAARRVPAFLAGRGLKEAVGASKRSSSGGAKKASSKKAASGARKSTAAKAPARKAAAKKAPARKAPARKTGRR